MKIQLSYNLNSKTVFFAILFVFSISVGYAQDAESVQNFFWGENDPYSSLLKIDEDYKNESAVVLGRFVYYNYENRGKKYEVIDAKRDRVKILDKAALESYSEFSFAEKLKAQSNSWSVKTKEGDVFFGVKIIKPDGKEEIVDLANAVELDGDENIKGVKKVALPNLEIGDIVDFYYYTIEPFKNREGGGFVFTPVIDLVSSSYPVENLNIKLIAEKDFIVNFNSFNGAPKVERKELQGDKREKYSYTFDVEKVDKIDYKRWVNIYNDLPTIKFQVIHSHSSSPATEHDAFTNEIDGVNKSISKNGLKAFLDHFFSRASDGIDYKTGKQFKKHGVDADKLTFLTGYFHSKRFSNNFSFYGVPSEVGRAAQLNAFLKNWDYNYEMYVVPNQEYATLQTVVFPQELSYIFRVDDVLDSGEPLYLTSFNFLTRMGDLPAHVQGQRAYIYSENSIKEATLPESSANQNYEHTELEVEILDDLTNAKLEGKRTFAGAKKYDGVQNWLNIDDFYRNETKIKQKSTYKLKKKNENFYGYSGTTLLNQLGKEIDSSKEKEATREEVISALAREFKVELEDENDFTYSVLERGLSPHNDEENLIAEFGFTTDELITKAGKNYMLPIGHLIGGQVSLDEDEIEKRDFDVFVETAKQFSNEIRISIPEGYTVKGLDELNMNVDNKSGSFISTAKQDGDEIVVNTKKVYKKKNVSKSDWNEMVDFLEAAYEFSQKKLLLTKG